MERIWLKQYPAGVPADIDVTQYSSLVELLEESFAKFADRKAYPVPNIILTDLKMARMGGFEFLHWLKAHPECAVIPTIVFSASSDPGDVKKAYDLGVNSYMVKPTALKDLAELIRVTYDYWSLCERPDRPPNC